MTHAGRRGRHAPRLAGALVSRVECHAEAQRQGNVERTVSDERERSSRRHGIADVR